DRVSIHRKGPAMRFSTSPLSRGRQRLARLHRTHPRVERLEDRTVPVTALQTLAFDSVSGQLAIVGDAQDNTVHSSSTAGGFVEVRTVDRASPGAPASAAFAPALAGADSRTLGRLRLDGGGGNDTLILDHYTAGQALGVSTDAAIVLAGPVASPDSLSI